MPFLVLGNGFLKLLLADIAPGADSIADNLDVELGHFAKQIFERNDQQFAQENLDKERNDIVSWLCTKPVSIESME